jgi:hypothetical protein
MEKNEQLHTEIPIVFPFLTKESLTGDLTLPGSPPVAKGVTLWQTIHAS